MSCVDYSLLHLLIHQHPSIFCGTYSTQSHWEPRVYPYVQGGGDTHRREQSHTLWTISSQLVYTMCLDYGKKLESQEKTHEAQSEQSKVGIEPSNPKM